MSVYIFIKIGRYMMGMEKPYYRKDIDGLRAVAVLAVIFYHAGFMTFFGGGYIGVDIFFVISGYIITRIIRYELDYETWSIINFYERRFRRILPPLFFMLVICLAMAWICYDLEQMKQLFRMLKGWCLEQQIYFCIKIQVVTLMPRKKSFLCCIHGL